jgi:DNA-binding NarL/FixJ family response regulator
MEPFSVVLLQNDPRAVQSLTACFSRSFRSVRSASSLEELRNAMAKHRPQVAVVDLERMPLEVVAQLAREFPAVCIVCTHRLADEQMWTAALNAGAVDICPSNDPGGVLNAALRNLKSSRHMAA